MINLFSFLFILAGNSGLSFSSTGTWHPEITQRPRILFKAVEKDKIIERIKNDNLYRDLYKNLYNSVFLTARTRAELAMIAKNAAFVYAINYKPAGNSVKFLSASERAAFREKVTTAFKHAEISVSSVFNFDDWQYRAKEIISFCEAFDLLVGSGVSVAELWQNGGERIHDFVSNLYKEVNNSLYQNYAPYNNFRIITGAALIIGAVAFNDVGSSDRVKQPANWIALGMSQIDKTLWDYQSSAEVEAGYSESTYYLTYAMKFGIPAIVALKNFLGDFIENFSGRIVRSPWFDQKYKQLFDSMTKLKRPDGRITPVENSYLNAMFPELALLGNMPGGSAHFSWGLSAKNFKDLDYSLSATYDLRADYICNAVDFSNPPADWTPTQFLPDAGSIVMRSSWDTSAIFLHVTGKHGRARNANSLIPSGHNHADETSFLLAVGGTMLVLHPGYYNYEQSNELKWGENHNLILVDGKGPDSSYAASATEKYIYGTDAYIKNYFTTSQLDFAEVFTHYQNTDFRRSILFPQKKYFILVDEIKSETNRTFTFQLHGNGLESDGTYLSNFSLNEAKWYCGDLILKAKVFAEGGGVRFSTVTQKHAPRYQTWDYHSTLHVDKDAAHTKFLSILFPYEKSRSEPDIQSLAVDDGTGVIIKNEKKVDAIVVNKESGNFSCSTALINGRKVSSDGRLLYCFLYDDDPGDFSIFFQEGTFIKIDDDTLVTLAQKASVYAKIGFNDVYFHLMQEDEISNSIFFRSVRKPDWVVGENIVRWNYTNRTVRIDLENKNCDITLTYAGVTGVSQKIGKIPAEFTLLQNYPNPVTATAGHLTTAITFVLAQPALIDLTIYNDQGRQIKILRSGEFPPGLHSVSWDGRDEQGRFVGNGIYFYAISSENFRLCRKMILLR